MWYHLTLLDQFKDKLTESMDEKITIIEGPPPSFHKIDDGWALGLNESASYYRLSITQLRTFNGDALVERCHRAWSTQSDIYLHYRNMIGLEERAPIVAARSMDTADGQVLVLWVRHSPDQIEEEEAEGTK